MSHKLTKRSRRHAEEETTQMNGDSSNNKGGNGKGEGEFSKDTPTNGEAAEVAVESTKRVIQTRSQSTEMKSADTTTGNIGGKEVNNEETETIDDASKDGEGELKRPEDDDKQQEAVEPPLAEEVSDDAPPSFPSNKDSNQVQVSEPTPKVLYIPVERLPIENNSVKGASPPPPQQQQQQQPPPPDDEPVDVDTTYDSYSSISLSMDVISTKAVAGSDETRNADLTCQEAEELEDSTNSNHYSLGESLRRLSSRRTIRPIVGNSYRKFAVRNRCDFIVGGEDAFKTYNSIEMVDNERKRKDRSITPEEEDSKRLKKDRHYGFLSYISSPLFSHFKTPVDSTPKLIAYEKKQVYSYGGDVIKSKSQEIENETHHTQKWCSIM